MESKMTFAITQDGFDGKKQVLCLSRNGWETFWRDWTDPAVCDQALRLSTMADARAFCEPGRHIILDAETAFGTPSGLGSKLSKEGRELQHLK